METENILNTLAQSAFVGSAISIVIQFIKNKFGVNSAKTRATIIALCLVGAGSFFFLNKLGYQDVIISFLAILGSASTFFNFIVKTTNIESLGKEEELG